MQPNARAIAERMSQRWCFRRRLPADVGGASIVVSAAGGLKYLVKPLSAVDPILLRNVREFVRAGNTLWDVGANLGLFAFAAAGIAGPQGRVIAFEPDVWLVQLLRRSVALQAGSVAPVRVVPAGVAGAVGLREFKISARARAANALAEYGGSQFGSAAEVQTIPVFNLDKLLEMLPHPDVVKIDVEGAEVEALAGQSAFLERCRPTIICEVAPENAASLTGILRPHRYRRFDGDRPFSAASEVGEAVWNTIAIPEERMRSYTA